MKSIMVSVWKNSKSYPCNKLYVSDKCWDERFQNMDSLILTEQEYEYVKRCIYTNRRRGELRYLDDFKRDATFEEVCKNHPSLFFYNCFINWGIPVFGKDLSMVDVDESMMEGWNEKDNN